MAPTTNLLSIAHHQVSVRWMSDSSVDLPFQWAHWLSVTSASLSKKTCYTIMSASIWRCIRSISIPKLRLTHQINPLQLSTLGLWILLICATRSLESKGRGSSTRQEKEHAENCRGRNKHKSYTTEFKKQTPDLLD